MSIFYGVIGCLPPYTRARGLSLPVSCSAEIGARTPESAPGGTLSNCGGLIVELVTMYYFGATQ